MIVYVKMDIFESPAQVIVNTVNTVGVMGKGIAKTYKDLYPEMFKEYQEYCEKGFLEVGKLWIYKSENKWILNFPTKKHWRNSSKLEYIELGLKKFVQTYKERGIRSISFPPLGCGNGGLDWESQVRPLMESYLSNLEIDIYIHVPLLGESAKKVEHKNLQETKRWLNLKPTQLSFIEVWEDLKLSIEKGIKINNNTEYLDVTIKKQNNDDIVTYYSKSKIVKRISKEDFYETWNLLKRKELLTDQNLASHLKENSLYIFQLFLKLPYVEHVTTLNTIKGKKVKRTSIRLKPIENNVKQEELFI